MLSRPSLTTILTANFLVAALLPVVLFGLAAAHYMTKNLEKEIADRNYLLAKALAGEVENFLSEPLNLLKQLEKICDSDQFIPESQRNAYLESVLQSHDFFETILILDRNGMIKHLAPFREDLIGTNLAGHGFFSATIERGKPYWSSTFISPQTGQPTLTVTRPIKTGMVVGYLNLSRLSRIIAKVKIGNTGRARIFDQEGTVIADLDRSLVAERWNMRGLKPIRQALAGVEGTLTAPMDGELRLFSTAMVSQTGWPVLVCQSVGEALAPIQTMRDFLILAALVTGTMAILIAMPSRWKALKPLAALAAYTHKVARGDYALTPLPGSYPEIDSLARDFETMMLTVQSREEALRESETKYRELVENANSIILRMDIDGNVIFFNEFAQRFFGYSEEQILGRSVVSTIVPETDSAGGNLAEMVGDLCCHPERYATNSHECVRKDGERVWISWTNRPIYDGEGHLSGLLCIGNDITEKKHEEEARIGLVTAIEQAQESIMIIDVKGIVQYVNPAFERISGYSRTDISGGSPNILRSGHHDPAFYRSMWATLARGEAWSGRLINRKKDGSLFQEEATISPVRNDAGVVVNYVAVKRDVTLEVELERQLQHASKMEAVGTLAGGIAHDFNNILQAVLGYGELLLLNRKENEDGHRELQAIIGASQRGADLVRQLLTFSRKVESKLRPVDLNHEVQQAHKLLLRTIPKMIAIELDFADDLRIVNADPAQIGQVLMNLAVNARDAMPEGGKLIIETRNVVLDEEYCRRHVGVPGGDYVLVSLSDTGIGMDQQTLEHIFEPFYTTKDAGKGTGLGLAMVYGIIKNHGGHILCYSEVGLGTTFKIYLPAVEPVAVPFEMKASQEVNPHGSETILLADDEEFIRDFAKQLLESNGYRVLTAEDGHEALAVYRQERDQISLVVLDLIMPRMGGTVCLTELLRVNPDLKVILSSGYSPDGHQQDFMAAGARAFLHKPYETRKLLKVVRQTLDEKT
ncbi:MAG TPA: hypothetical protein DEO88_03080 [Syntrophobacteraceae bacterium]|nr:hypothetical protein [Syntrophobacteraceae bacterium]